MSEKVMVSLSCHFANCYRLISLFDWICEMLWLPRYVCRKINLEWITLSLNSLLKWESNPCLFFLILFLQTHFVFFVNVKRVHRSHNRCHWILYEDIYPNVVICFFVPILLYKNEIALTLSTHNFELAFSFSDLRFTSKWIII